MTLAFGAASMPTKEAVSARARVSLVSFECGSHAVFFMVLLGFPGAKSMVQEERLPFEY